LEDYERKIAAVQEIKKVTAAYIFLIFQSMVLFSLAWPIVIFNGRPSKEKGTC